MTDNLTPEMELLLMKRKQRNEKLQLDGKEDPNASPQDLVNDEKEKLFKFEWSALEARIRGVIGEYVNPMRDWKVRTDAQIRETDFKIYKANECIERLNETVFWQQYKGQERKSIFNECLHEVTEIRARLE